MKKLQFLLMCCLVVDFAACNDDKSSNVSAVSVFKSGTQDGHDYVDLGLPSGTKWATANIGAKKSQDYGNYYAWGETTTKDYYDWSNYKFGSDYLTKYCDNSDYGKGDFTDNKVVLEPVDDAAYVNWGGKWRMPTRAQQEELRDECYWVWTDSYNDSNVAGYIVYKAKESSDKGKQIYVQSSHSKREPSGETPSLSYSLFDAHIFLPAAGYRSRSDLSYAGSGGYYWSSSLCVGYNPYGAWRLNLFLDDGVDVWDGSGSGRPRGLSVRAVFK